MNKIAGRAVERRARRYLGWLLEVSIVLTVVPLVVHGVLSANGPPIM